MTDILNLLNAAEDENTEFKEAKNSFEFDNLSKYACALANKGGGRVVLGVSDRRPRKIVGSKAFNQPERTRKGLMERLGINVTFEIVSYDSKRILIFNIPSRPIGMPIQDKGVYWGRHADGLYPIDEVELRLIFSESGRDFSSEICPDAKREDLDSEAIEDFRQRWIIKSKNVSIESSSQDQILEDCEAIVDGGITWAALVLFGTRKVLGRLLPQSELVFEYRNNETSGAAQQREEFRKGFFSWYDRFWTAINNRNETQHFRSGLFVLDVPTFDEQSVREAVLNAVSHRDYQLGGSIYIRQYPRKLTIESPGGFPFGITEENILKRQVPRNRRIADIFTKCGLVERSGQGMNLMFETSIKNGKQVPDFRGTDKLQVNLTLDGQIQDEALLRMMDEIGNQTLSTFTTQDFLLVDMVRRDKCISEDLRERLPRLVDLGIIEKASRNRYILGKRYYYRIGSKGKYTRKRGLDRETKKQLLLKHIREAGVEGSKLRELRDVLPAESRSQVQVFLRELRVSDKIHAVGKTNAARWYIGTE